MSVEEGHEAMATLIEQIEDQDDPRESLAMVRQRIAQIQEAGDEVPVELMRVHKAIETDLILQSRGW